MPHTAISARVLYSTRGVLYSTRQGNRVAGTPPAPLIRVVPLGYIINYKLYIILLRISITTPVASALGLFYL
jgi:hypothetical protein